MCAQRQDYILRLLEQLTRFIAEVTGLRRAGRPDEALMAVLQAQEKLFARPINEIVAMPVEEQIRLLCAHESPSVGRDKCIAHATLLHAMGEAYLDKEQPALAHGAWRLSTQVLWLTTETFPAAQSPELTRRIEPLLDAEPTASNGNALSNLLCELRTSTS